MIFSSYEFLLFFAVVFTAYWLIPTTRPRHLLLWVASCYFYMSWNPWFILLIGLTAGIDWAVALRLEGTSDVRARKAFLTLSIVSNLLLLGVFKYANFFVENVSWLLSHLGFRVDPVILNIILPVGISFFTFQSMSYTIDVYRREIPARRSFFDFSLFVIFFPQLVAGPIVRARDFLPQLAPRKVLNATSLASGARVFAQGYFKKSFISDRISPHADAVFADPSAHASGAIWLGVVLYAIQIYCDFSGYSDMAIGCARTFGFELCENFHMPYFATNITEFWRRWHISLSTWLRDYLYIPLGGNRGTALYQRRNLMLTMLLGGLWHGASWNFVIWGGLHGIYLVVHKAFVSWRGFPGKLPNTFANKIGAVASGLFTFLLVCVTWVFFRAQTLEAAGIMLRKMFAWTNVGAMIQNPWLYVVIAFVLVAHILATFVRLGRVWRRTPLFFKTMAWTAFAVTVVLFTPLDPQPFIYFQF